MSSKHTTEKDLKLAYEILETEYYRKPEYKNKITGIGLMYTSWPPPTTDDCNQIICIEGISTEKKLLDQIRERLESQFPSIVDKIKIDLLYPVARG